jgi:glutamate/tyrosine decarboxylase-like PLP-dependent enzyme
MAREATLDDTPSTLEEVIPRLVHCLEGLYIFGHPRCQINVVPPPSIASIIGVLLPSIYNPNLCSEESGRLISEAEVRVASMMARMMGYDPHQASGVFTFGGTGTMLYGARIGIEKAVPDALRRGVDRGIAVLASDCAHYSLPGGWASGKTTWC